MTKIPSDAWPVLVELNMLSEALANAMMYGAAVDHDAVRVLLRSVNKATAAWGELVAKHPQLKPEA